MPAEKRTVRQVHTGREVVIVLPPIKAPTWLQGFVDFVREQGVVGLSVGLILVLKSPPPYSKPVMGLKIFCTKESNHALGGHTQN